MPTQDTKAMQRRIRTAILKSKMDEAAGRLDAQVASTDPAHQDATELVATVRRFLDARRAYHAELTGAAA